MLQLTRHVRDVGKAHTHTLEHWFLECGGTKAICTDIFDDVHPPLKALMDERGKAGLMTRRAL